MKYFEVKSRRVSIIKLIKNEVANRAFLKKELKGFLYNLINILIILVFSFHYSSITNASVNIPLDSPFYRDIAILDAKGLIKSDLLSTKPITRKEAGRLLAEAIYFSETENIPYATSKLLDRMAEDYEEEISEAEGSGRIPSTFVKPVDEFSVTYNYLDGPFSMFNNEGINYVDGTNAVVQFETRARLWNVFSFYIQPLFINKNARENGGSDETETRIHKGYLKFTIDNFEIELGRDSLWWGPGYHGALLLSNNARPFDMYKLSNPQATLLPSFFRYLGPFKYNLFYSTLDKEATSGHPPDSRLFGARFDFKPHPLLELGISYLAHCNGDRTGIGGLTTSDYLYILFSNECRSFDKRDSNKEFSMDAALTIPNISDSVPLADSIKLYAEWGGEDQGVPPDKRAYLAGMALNNIFTAPGLKLVTEYANLSPKSAPGAWYTHSVWAMKYYGRVFGHHAGTDSDDLFIELSHSIKDKFFYKLGFDKERNGIHKVYTQKKIQYFITAGCDFRKWFNLAVKYGQEEISNVGNMKGAEQGNRLLGMEVTLKF